MKTIKIIKMVSKIATYCTIFLTTCSVMAFSIYGQDLKSTKVSINLKDTSPLQIIKSVEKQTPFSFVYDDALKTNNKRISLHKKNVSVYEVLQLLSKKAQLEFKRINNNISVSVASKEIKVVLKQRTITGTVTNLDGEPLPGVNVMVKGKNNIGTSTDFDGNFTLDIPEDTKVIEVSYVGFKAKEVTITEQSNYIIKLEEDLQALNEVVVIGYGSQNKNDVTGAVTMVKSDELISVPSVSAEQALQGRAAGVTIINTGSPGNTPTVRVRGVGTLGDNNPVFVVDGIVTNDISNLNANDIESMSVLKDASTTSVFGSLGANGVIVIKTKQGSDGKVKFDFSAYGGLQMASKKMDLLNSEQYIAYAKDLFTNAGEDLPVRLTDSRYSSFIKNNTDWQDAVFQSGMMQNYHFSASGGNEHSNFRLSTGYLNQEGIILNTGIERFTFRLNGNYEKGIFKVGENLAISLSDQNQMVNANSISPLEYAIRMAPYLPVYDSSNLGGFRGPDQIDGQDARNPARTLTRQTISQDVTSILGNVFAEIKLLKDLTYKANVGINYTYGSLNNISLPFADGEYHTQTTTSIGKYKTTQRNVTYTNSLNYLRTFNEKHNVDVLLLAEKEKRKYDMLSGSGQTESSILQLPDDAIASSSLVPYARIGYLARINYDYDGKYLFSASFRRDGSSRFGANNRWGNFPSFSAGWVISKENFFGDDTAMNYFKVRGSWGKAGNDKIGDFSFSSSLFTGFNYGTNAGIAMQSLANPDLKWEETAVTNLGMDLGFFNNQLTLSAEYYINQSEDLLINVPSAASVGLVNATPKNIGGMKTSGLEFNLQYNNREGEFKWSAGVNFSTTNNEVTSMASNVTEQYAGSKPNILGADNISRIAVGEPLWHFYGWQVDGIFQNQAEIDAAATQANAAPGDIRFKDINNDKVIDDKDKVVIGNPFPDITYGFNFDASYKNFDFSLLFAGVSGNKIFNTTRFYLDGADRLFNAGTAVLDRWTTSNPSTTQPRAVNGDPNKNTRASDRYVEDGSFLRLRNLTVGYNVDEKIIKNLFGKQILSKVRFYVSGQNLLTFTNYSGYDPEIGSALGAASLVGNTNSEIGVDRGQYPQPISIVTGVQLSF